MRAVSLSLWRGAKCEIWCCSRNPHVTWSRCGGAVQTFDMACATLSALCACWIALVVARCKFYIARACLSPQFVRVGSLSLWCGANFNMARATLAALRVLDRSRCGTVLILADSLGSWNPGKEIFWVICNVLIWRSCNILVVHHTWDQGLVEVLVAVQILITSCRRRSLHDLVQVLIRRSKILLTSTKSSLRDLA